MKSPGESARPIIPPQEETSEKKIVKQALEEEQRWKEVFPPEEPLHPPIAGGGKTSLEKLKGQIFGAGPARKGLSTTERKRAGSSQRHCPDVPEDGTFSNGPSSEEKHPAPPVRRKEFSSRPIKKEEVFHAGS